MDGLYWDRENKSSGCTGTWKSESPSQLPCRSVTMETPCLCLTAVNVSKTQPSDELDSKCSGFRLNDCFTSIATKTVL